VATVINVLNQRLPELDDPVDFLVPRSTVSCVTDFIVEPRVRRHLTVAVIASPLLCRFQQRASVSMTSYVCIDVPCFDVSDGARVTTVCVRPCANFYESSN
jgi:hypothetical protein